MRVRWPTICTETLLPLIVVSLAACAAVPPARRGAAAVVAVRPEARRYTRFTIPRWRDGHRAACTLSFDDGTLDQYLVGFPELQRRGLKATFFLHTGPREEGVWQDGAVTRRLLSWAQAAEILAAGNEIASHGVRHADLNRSTREEILAELAGSLGELLWRLPLRPPLTFAFPFWRSTPLARREASFYYLAARGGTGLPQRYLEQNGGVPGATPEDMFDVNSLSARNSDRGGSWLRVLDRTLVAGGWLVVTFHGIDDGTVPRDCLGWEALPLPRFQAVLDGLEAADLWIAPFGRVVRYVRERDAAALLLRGQTPSVLTVALEDGLEDRVYDEPLTVRLWLPEGWRAAALFRDGEPLPFRREPSGALVFAAPPDGRLITVQRRGAPPPPRSASEAPRRAD